MCSFQIPSRNMGFIIVFAGMVFLISHRMANRLLNISQKQNAVIGKAADFGFGRIFWTC